MVMDKINLKKIIEERSLDVKQVALHLFPGNKHPRLALNRVLSDEAVLDADQISKLSLLADLPISDLYNKGVWKAKAEKGIHMFSQGDYNAELDTTTWVTKIFHRRSLFHESIIHSKFAELGEYLQELDKQIIKFKEK